MNKLNKLDLSITTALYNLFNSNNKFIKNIPYLFGLIPYEIYVIPGMYISMLQVLWFGSPSPLQFHLLPHFFAYSFFQNMKKSIKSKRPGCFHNKLSKYIDASHCSKSHRFQSFPSGHTGVASALATALCMEMLLGKPSKFFDINVGKTASKVIASLGYFVVLMISLHRISKGYHSFFDVISGMILGSMIGFICWLLLEFYKTKYDDICKNYDTKDDKYDTKDDKCDIYKNKENELKDYWLKDWNFAEYKIFKDKSFIGIALGITRVVLTIPILFLFIKFIIHDLPRLTQIKH